MIVAYETVDGTGLDVITFEPGDDEATFDTGRAEGVVDQAVRRTGSLDAAIEDLADWSNGYVSTRAVDE